MAPPGSGGSAGSTTAEGGAGGMTAGAGGMTGASDAGGMGGSGGSGGEVPSMPYAPRSGSFTMLLLTRTAGFRHGGSIDTGTAMLADIAAEQGFEIVRADSQEEINEMVTPAGLMPFEIVFHLNTTGDFLNDEQQITYEDWMTNNGAYVGVHSATDTENGWAFYTEITGQFYNGHGPLNTVDQIQFEPAAADFVATQGFPNPWQRIDEWFRFDSHLIWTTKPGFTVLARKAADGEPCIWTRQYGNFRAFYTCLGHSREVFDGDPQVKTLLTGAIMWAVRREHLIQN